MPDETSQPSPWKKKLVNFWQSQKERKAKYWLLRSLGVNCYQARRQRDWRLSKIERAYALQPSTPTLTEHSMLQD